MLVFVVLDIFYMAANVFLLALLGMLDLEQTANLVAQLQLQLLLQHQPHPG